DNISVVFVEFEWGTDLDEAANDIRDYLSFIENYLPENAEKPVIYKFNSSMMPILFYSVTADESLEGLDKIIEEKIANPLNKIDGIGSIGFRGAPTREILVEVDPIRLEAYNLTVEQIGNALMMENINMPSGSIEMGKIEYPLKVEGEFKDSKQIENIVVANYNGNVIFLKDVATVKDGPKDTNLEESINGKKGARMFVMKKSGGNTVKIAKDVRKELKKIEKTLPKDVKINVIMDSSEFIEGSISNLTETLFYAFIFVTLVVFFFLGHFRATFIIILTIPISLVVAFIYLYITGNSINIISLSSLSIAIGMVVDDAIVVLENISKHIDRGSSPREAAIYATNEVWLAVIVTTATVVAVFMPLTLVGGMTGVLFKQLGWTVSITVVTSTIAAISLTPMLSAYLLKIKPKKEKYSPLSWERTALPVLNWLDNFYGRSLRWALNHKMIVSVASLLIFVSSFLVIGKIGTEFMPEADSGSISASIELQTGTRFEETLKISRLIDEYVNTQIPEAKIKSTSSGSDDTGSINSLFQSSASNTINYSIKLVDVEERDRSVVEISEDFRKYLATIPEIISYSVTNSGGMSMGIMGGGSTVEVEIYGHDLEGTTLYAKELQKRIDKIAGAREVTISREKFKPELSVKLDREKLARHGLNTATVSTMIKNRVSGMIATRYREFGDEYNVVVKFKEDSRNSVTDVENILITTPSGSSVRLKELGTVEQKLTPPNIERKRKQRIVTVSATPYKISLGDLAASVQGQIDEMGVPQGMTVQIGGAYEDMNESFVDIALLALLSLLLVYIVMASQFESFKMPLIIMVSILFIVPGIVFTLYLTGTNLSIIAALGAVLLIGIVVKNGIVLVDFINLMRDRGMELKEAIIVSGKSRLRPVLMTALTTILGMVPMAFSSGEGSEIWSPMGIAVIGGLTFSTIITMIIVPVTYAIMARRGERDRLMSVRKKFHFLDKE
nr:efflux RND transporter permease subunit [Prolixibacteraceae bacterium]